MQAAAVFGVPDDDWGERLEAAVVLQDPLATPEIVDRDLRQSLPDFMVPKGWHVLAELPLGPTGKVDRTALMKMAAPTPETGVESGE